MFSVRQMFQDLGLPTFNTLLHNTMLGFKNTYLNVNNQLVLIVHIYLDVVILLLRYLVFAISYV